jgi:hypothetical protein
MHKNDPPTGNEKQASIDLAGCRSALVPGTDIRLIIPDRDAEKRLGRQLDVPSRLAAIRADALRNLAASAEVFAQRTFAIGQRFYLSASVLTTQNHWRGGWLMFQCPAGEEEKLIEYIHAARDAVVFDLRKERLQRGSKS